MLQQPPCDIACGLQAKTEQTCSLNPHNQKELQGRSIMAAVCESTSQGGRPYMEDLTFCARDGNTMAAAVFDGHGGRQAADYAQAYLWENFKSHKNFNSKNPSEVSEALREAFLATHRSMAAEQERWPRRPDGYQSTSGTTATIAVVRGDDLWVGHVGDSRAIINEGHEAVTLTRDHKASDAAEQISIKKRGGMLYVSKQVTRVVWKRKVSNIVNGRPSSGMATVPFLNMTRSLGDFWSWNPDTKEYTVSPDPDIHYQKLTDKNDYVILGSDGIWDVISARECLDVLAKHKKKEEIDDDKHHSETPEHDVTLRNIITNASTDPPTDLDHETTQDCDTIHPCLSKIIVEEAEKRWTKTSRKADNLSAVVLFTRECICGSNCTCQSRASRTSTDPALVRSGTASTDPQLDTPGTNAADDELPPAMRRSTSSGPGKSENSFNELNRPLKRAKTEPNRVLTPTLPEPDQ
eukprot:m.29266 g.29266  ORF g.29266 m.29266 type:complete len:465 (+) comp8084_c0_seq2:269-1663(+)